MSYVHCVEIREQSMTNDELIQLKEMKKAKEQGNLDGFGWSRLTKILYNNIDWIISVAQSSRTSNTNCEHPNVSTLTVHVKWCTDCGAVQSIRGEWTLPTSASSKTSLLQDINEVCKKHGA